MQDKQGIDDTVIRLCRDWDNWVGSHYELAIQFDPDLFDQNARLRLLRHVWHHPSLLGVVELPDDFGHSWLGTDDLLHTEDAWHYYGCIRFDENDIVGCGSVFSGTSDGLWFILYVPLTMVGRVYPVDYESPITHEGNPWTLKVDELLAAIGRSVYQEFPFVLGALGEEAAGVPRAILMANLAHDTQLLIPESLFHRMGVTPHGLRFPEGLWWTGGKEKAAKTY